MPSQAEEGDGGANAAGDELKAKPQQRSNQEAKRLKLERLNKLKAKENTLIRKFAKRWDPDGVKAPKGETLNLFLGALDNGEADAIKPLKAAVDDLKVGRLRVRAAVDRDRNLKKDPRTPCAFLIFPSFPPPPVAPTEDNEG
eukprot:COSAG01_NODE_21975_length_877_cov_1.340617_2_plen_142_part_00